MSAMEKVELLIQSWELNVNLLRALKKHLPDIKIEPSQWGYQYATAELKSFQIDYPKLRQAFIEHDIEAQVLNVEVLYEGAHKRLRGKMGDDVGFGVPDERPIVAFRYNGRNGEAVSDYHTPEGQMNYVVVDPAKFERAEREAAANPRVEHYS